MENASEDVDMSETGNLTEGPPGDILRTHTDNVVPDEDMPTADNVTPDDDITADDTIAPIDDNTAPTDNMTDDTAVEHPVDIKEEMLEECELATDQWVEPTEAREYEVDDDITETEEEELLKEVEEGEEEGDNATSTEKQIAEIAEENDRESYTEGYEKYLKTQSSDKAALHAAVHKQQFKPSTPSLGGIYEPGEVVVFEMFPKKDYGSYLVIADGHRYILNSRKGMSTMYRCRKHEPGCTARVRLNEGFLGKANYHTCVDDQRNQPNQHYVCVYCEKEFVDLEERKKHILEEPHFNGPWPIKEELCLIAEYTRDKTLLKQAADAMPINKDLVVHVPLPTDIESLNQRLCYSEDKGLIVLRYPGSTEAPVYPKPELFPTVPHNTPRCKVNMLMKLINGSEGATPIPLHLVSPAEEQRSKKKKRKDNRHGDGDPPPAKRWKKTKQTPDVAGRSRGEREYEGVAADVALKIRNSRIRKIGNKENEANLSTQMHTDVARTVTAGRKDSEEVHSVPQRIENIIEEYENKVVLHCDLCNVELGSLKQRADHDMSNGHQENKRKLLEENEKSRASLTFDKPIFTDEFLKYNKALEAELRGLRKGAVELEEQNAVLSSHIDELNNVVMELRNAKLMMQKHHSTLDGHLKDLKSELSKVFASVLSTDVSTENFNETFNKLSVAVTGKGGSKRASFDGISNKLKRHLKQAQISTVTL